MYLHCYEMEYNMMVNFSFIKKVSCSCCRRNICEKKRIWL